MKCMNVRSTAAVLCFLERSCLRTRNAKANGGNAEACRFLGVDFLPPVRASLYCRSFHSLSHRLRLVRRFRGKRCTLGGLMGNTRILAATL